MLPNFIIVGAMKAGTTSFASALRTHPDVYMPEREVHFFDNEACFQQGLPCYETFFTAWSGETAVGEKTPTYSYAEKVPGRIAELTPDVKLIWLFREPIARAYSHYWFFISLGKERRAFPQALDREATGAVADFTMRYRDRSVYATQVERYLTYFKPEQMLYLLFEDLVRDPHAVLRRACEFLGVDPEFTYPEDMPRDNRTRIPASIPLQWLAFHTLGGQQSRIVKLVKRYNTRLGSNQYPAIPAEVQNELAAFYAPHNQRLAEITGLDLSAWQR
ncbi:MAG: sulfotransferase domain-containing protein [Chloroflexi bacterium]|nr:sulfotransferase domain-containing protein [Chloroflexota bacterium]